MPINPYESPQEESEANRLSSEALAGLIVDSLLRAKIIDERDADRSIKIAAEEIQVRKYLGDY